MRIREGEGRTRRVITVAAARPGDEGGYERKNRDREI